MKTKRIGIGTVAGRIAVGFLVFAPYLAFVIGYKTLATLHELGERTLDAVDRFIDPKWN